MKGLIYTSEELYWDGMTHEFYSHVFSRVVTPERTLEGTYFRSDEAMEHYLVSNSKGSFLAEDMGGEEEEQPPAVAEDSTAEEQQSVRPAPEKRRKY